MGTHERKEREKEQRREEILHAATKVFFEKGLSASTMDDIAERAELSKGTLYLYYHSKEDLYLAVMNVGIDILNKMFVTALAQASDTIDGLRRLCETYFAFFRDHRQYFRMFHFFQNLQFHKQVSPDMLEICRVNNQRIWSTVIDLLRRGVQEGLLRTDVEPTEMAVMLWSSPNAIMLQIDYQADHWREHLHVDLERVLRVSNALLLESVMTEETRSRSHAQATSGEHIA